MVAGVIVLASSLCLTLVAMMREIWIVTSGCRTEIALNSVIGILASSLSRMACSVEGRGLAVMQSSSPTLSPWPYSSSICTPPPSFSLIERSRPLMT